MGRSIPDGEGVIPPRGYVRVFNQSENRTEWVDPASIVCDLHPVSVLTPTQVERIKAFREIIAEHETMTFEEAIRNFSGDHHPGREIWIWESIAKAYEAEIARRPKAEPQERELIYATIFILSFAGTLEAVLSVAPPLKALNDLKGVVDRFQEIWKSRLKDSKIPEY